MEAPASFVEPGSETVPAIVPLSLCANAAAAIKTEPNNNCFAERIESSSQMQRKPARADWILRECTGASQPAPSATILLGASDEAHSDVAGVQFGFRDNGRCRGDSAGSAPVAENGEFN
jgi:hypothetical protein